MQPKKTIEIVSEKHGVSGRIEDYGVVIKLFFTYEGREYVLGLYNSLTETLAETGLKAMEAVIERLSSSSKDMYLHYWYIFDKGGEMHARGNVTGNPKIEDSVRVTTSPVVSVTVDEDCGEAIIMTAHSVYRCPLEYWRFDSQDKYEGIRELVSDYDSLKEKYKDKLVYPEIEQGRVLLVLADFCEYYFHSLCVKDENGKRLDCRGQAHIGMFQDSFLIGVSWDNPAEIHDKYRIDIRYFPHYKNIEFYSDETAGMPLYAENIGSSDIYVRRNADTFRLKSGERKELIGENAEATVSNLPDGDLYPAGID